jgi:hypothetical protein
MSASIASGAVIFFKVRCFGGLCKKIETVKGKAMFISQLQYSLFCHVGASGANAKCNNLQPTMQPPLRLSFSHFCRPFQAGREASAWLLASGC